MKIAQKQNFSLLIIRIFSYAIRTGHSWLRLSKAYTRESKATEVMLHSPDPRPCLHTPPLAMGSEKVPSLNSLCQELLRRYIPDIQKNVIGQEARAILLFEPRQRICYYPGKIHGGYQAFLMDQLFADCCKPAVTANLTMEFMHPIQPDIKLVLRVWPVKIEGRKTWMEGAIKIPEKCSDRLLLAARATALFILPKA
ncbi:HotDog domain-containing protein [Penicillium samsonianum]|uniref:HotDog domain-containing protein n=1 Tax=Penicillium samsonianum TaxID=1882272 RepID=UPI002547FA12|nr:HotDog domain-containing protein [Penicillium samsonianum]KAJ6125931.1 HotDog domain-containing protein [Penicillium samsonianum]